MKCEGVRANIVSKDGVRYPEYENPHEHDHYYFYGRYGTRRICAAPNTEFETVIEFTEDFSLYEANGVLVHVVIGNVMPTLQPGQTSQDFWITADQLAVQRTYRFAETASWEWSPKKSPAPIRRKSFQVPAPEPKAWNDAAWNIIRDHNAVAKGSVGIYIRRAMFDLNIVPRPNPLPYPTYPPWQPELTDIGGAKINDAHWIKDFVDDDGHDSRFEFVNIGPAIFEQPAQEAEEEFGQNDAWKFPKYGDKWRYVEPDRSACVVVVSPASSTSRPRAARRSANRARRPREQSRSAKKSKTEPPSKHHTIIFLRKGGGSIALDGYSCCDDVDDEEPLPVKSEPKIKEEDISEGGSRKTQDPTPPPEQPPVRETTEELYGVTPDRMIRGVDRTGAAENLGEASEQQAGVAEVNADDNAMDIDEDYDFQVRMAEIARTRRMQEAAAEAEYQEQIARIALRQRAQGRQA